MHALASLIPRYETLHFPATHLFLIQNSAIWLQMSSSNFPSFPLGRKNSFEKLQMGEKRNKASHIIPCGWIMKMSEPVVTP